MLFMFKQITMTPFSAIAERENITDNLIAIFSGDEVFCQLFLDRAGR